MKKKYFIAIFLNIFILLSNTYPQTNHEAIYNRAIDNIDKENYTEAISLLLSIQDKNDYMVFYNLGFCYYRLENDELAQTYLKKSIELNDTFVNSYGYLGMSYYFTKKINEAEKAFLRCIELNKTNYKNYYYLGKIYEQKDNENKAIEYYLEALKYNEKDFYTNYSLANIYFDKNDYTKARKYFEICDAIDDQVYPVVSCLIRIKYRQEDFENIEKLKQRLRTIKQNSKDKRIIELSRFTIDTFIYKDYHIFVEESFNLSGILYYYWTFRIYDTNDNFIRSVNLESSLALREMGTAYIVGIDRFEKDRRIHQTTNITFTKLPDYGVMKNIVIEEIEKGLDVGATGVYPYRD